MLRLLLAPNNVNDDDNDNHSADNITRDPLATAQIFYNKNA